MPTIALVNGHAFAGGFMVAMMHDYRCMNPHKGFLCLNELELGVPLRPPMSSVFREKVSAATLRRLVLEAHRFKVCCLHSSLRIHSPSTKHYLQALDALKEGIVDWLGGLPEVLAHVDEFKLVQKSQKGMSGLHVYGDLKQEMFRETIDYLQSTTEESIRQSARQLRLQREAKEKEVMVNAWERSRPKL
jgi:Delta3-Delta2-enoyl-CoA isomerase